MSRLAGGPVLVGAESRAPRGSASRWFGTITVISGQPVAARQPPRAHVVARGDREEALARPARRASASSAAARIGPRARDTSSARRSRPQRARDGSGSAAAPRRCVGVNRPSTARAPSPKRRSRNSSTATSQPTAPTASWRCPSSGAPRRPRARRVCAPDEPRRLDPTRALEAQQRGRRQLSAHAVDRTRVEPVGLKPDLEGGDASTGREPAGSEHEDANEHRDADDGEATHAPDVRRRAAPSSPPSATEAPATISRRRSPVAQLVEHPAVNRRVSGSSPLRGVEKPRKRGAFLLLYHCDARLLPAFLPLDEDPGFGELSSGQERGDLAGGEEAARHAVSGSSRAEGRVQGGAEARRHKARPRPGWPRARQPTETRASYLAIGFGKRQGCV